MPSRIYVELTDAQALRMSQASKYEKVTMNDFVFKAVMQYIKKTEKKQEQEEE